MEKKAEDDVCPTGWLYFDNISDAIIEIVGDSLDTEVVAGPPDKFYNPGSHITLKCIIRIRYQPTENNSKLVWNIWETFGIQNMIQTR